MSNLMPEEEERLLSMCMAGALVDILRVVSDYAAKRGQDKDDLTIDERRAYKRLVARLDRPIRWANENFL